MSATATRERPIIFSAESVRAILRGDKTQTRRVIKPQPEEYDHKFGGICLRWRQINTASAVAKRIMAERCPHGQPGDRLWVRERVLETMYDTFYLADPGTVVIRGGIRKQDGQWYSPMFMPRRLSRLTLRITHIWAERLHDITELSAYAEGFPRTNHLGELHGCYISDGTGNEWQLSGATSQFALAWNELNAKRGYGWDTNPWVWCITFEVAK